MQKECTIVQGKRKEKDNKCWSSWHDKGVYKETFIRAEKKGMKKKKKTFVLMRQKRKKLKQFSFLIQSIFLFLIELFLAS